MSNTTDILIVGAGLTGLASAIFLKGLGYALRIVDKPPKHDEWGRADGILPRGMEIYDHIVGNQIVDISKKIGLVAMYENGEKLPGYMDNNDPLNDLGVFVERSTTVVAFDIHEDGKGVRSVLEKESGAIEDVDSKYLIGADGGHSFVRRKIGTAFECVVENDEDITIAFVDAIGGPKFADAENFK
ncbi:hypothetical protein BC938DRAFT_475683 [Jimgerdemannia flammicorona]|uniref:FAD-binding domain-containing protein n=1 Tax=Jimgerdemannia flammicorona TaxID=994334 RepID=A0A433PQ84_9FUNG|nr:hypothetical protein BC938DRAFT_475683 [Jimgerdemannia flammicorona]